MTSRFASWVAAVALAVGGVGPTGCSSMKPGRMAAVTPETTEQPRVGTVYLLRGFIGVFSTGIDRLGERIDAAGVHAEVFQESQANALAAQIAANYKGKADPEPIVIVGHSYGADSAVKIARRLTEHGVKVDLIVTLDPVTPGKVPANVGLVYNLYQSNGALDNLPWLRGIPLTADTPGPVALRNMDIRTDRTDLLEPGLDHFNIEKKEKVQADVVAQVLNVCQPRAAWAAGRALRNQVATARDATPDVDRASGLGDKQSEALLFSSSAQD